MPDGINAEIILVVTVFLITVVGNVVSILTYTNAVKERDGRTAAEAVSIKKDISSLSESIEDMKGQLDEALSGYHENDKRIATLESRMKAVEARVKILEGHHITK